MTAFTRGDTYNLLMTLGHGDLDDLLLQRKTTLGFQGNSEIFNSLWGLSSAISALHGYFVKAFDISRIGTHCDIRPGNILCVEGKLVLSDFGPPSM